MTPPLLAVSSTTLLLTAGVGALVLLLAALLWLVFGRGPRRRRAYQRAQHLLHEGKWEEALAAARAMIRLGPMSAAWEGRLRNLQGECRHVAGDAALKDKQYEDALKHYAAAADFLNLDTAEFRGRVVDGMLAEAMRLFAAGPTHNEAVHQFLARILLLEKSSPAALFWQGLCHLRDNKLDQATAALQAAHDHGKGYLDPPLYLGMVQLRQGRPHDALRSLAEANRLDPSCPFVPLYMGLALVAGNGDSGLAVRALERALSNRGLGQWEKTPQKAWAEGLPENRSFIRRLASKYPFVCPINGSDLTPLLSRGRFALGQAYYRLGRYQEAADVFAQLLQESPPSAPLLRAHGLALARLERYDQAYKQLRIALDIEPNDILTAGYLALCGALGKPAQAEDKPRNVAWAVKQLVKFERYGDPEWARICSRVLAEARALDLPVAAEDQQRLCDVLASVFATDPEAAAAYDHLAATAPASLRAEHAWLYCQAAHQHGLTGRCDLEMFGRTFREAEAAQQFYQQRGWDFEAVEYAYLERSAKARPGHFPEELGPNYTERGVPLLLARSRRLEESGNRDGALAAADVLLRLSPTTTQAHDRLAQLYYARGELDRAAALLAGWARLEPTNHLPLVRRAVIEQQRRNPAGRAEAIRAALAQTHGSLRAGIAFLGARLALEQPGAGYREAQELLQECLKEEPGHAGALWLLAALRCVTGDRDGLAALARLMHRPAERDPHFHYMAAVCFLAAGDYAQVLEACRRAWAEPSLLVECRYLMGWAHLRLGDAVGAVREWEVVARDADSPSAPHAQALLGRLRFGQGNYEEAIHWWNRLAPDRRAAWGLDEPLRATEFLAGLQALAEGRFDQAAECFSEAEKLGLRDRRVGPLRVLALLKAGQQRLYHPEAAAETPIGEKVSI